MYFFLIANKCSENSSFKVLVSVFVESSHMQLNTSDIPW